MVSLLVSRSEIDLADIKKDYERIFRKTLETSVESISTGDYQKGLLAIVKGNSNSMVLDWQKLIGQSSAEVDKSEEEMKDRSETDEKGEAKEDSRPVSEEPAENEDEKEKEEEGVSTGENKSISIAPVASRTNKPTVVSFEGFDAKADAKVISDTLISRKPSPSVISDILSKRTANQRFQIASQFEQNYSKKLSDSIMETKQFSDNFRIFVNDLLLKPSSLAAEDLARCNGADKDTLSIIIGIVLSSTTSEIQQIKEEFNQKNDGNLKDELNQIPNIGTVLASFVSRPSSASPPQNDMKQAKEDANEINEHKEDSDKLEESLKSLFSTRGKTQMRTTFDLYHQLYEEMIEIAIKRGLMSAEVESAYSMLVEVTKSEVSFYRRLFKEINSEMDVLRMVIGRSEIDLGAIMEEFKEVYEENLISRIQQVVQDADTFHCVSQMLSVENGDDEIKPSASVSLKKDNRDVPTLVDCENFNIDEDVEELDNFFNNEDEAESLDSVTFLAKRSLSQRGEIKAAFEEKGDLLTLLSSSEKISDENVSKLLLDLFKNWAYLNFNTCKDIFSAKEKTSQIEKLLEIIAVAPSPEDIQQLKEVYAKGLILFIGFINAQCCLCISEVKKGNFEKDLGSFCPTPFSKKLLPAILNKRSTFTEKDDEILKKAKSDAETLKKLVTGKISKDKLESHMIDILTNRSFTHSRAIFDYFEELNDGEGIESVVVKKQFKSDFDQRLVSCYSKFNMIQLTD